MRRRRRRNWPLISVLALVPMAALAELIGGHGPTASTSIPAEPPRSAAVAAHSLYDAIVDRAVRPYPPLPPLGRAGFRFTDPTFGSRMVRVTDERTRPDQVGRAWFSPSSAETSAWNTNSTKFYVTGGGGEQVPYRFDAVTMTASRIGNRRDATGGLVLHFSGEPSFSFVDPDVIYGQAGSRIVSYRFSTASRRTLHDEHTCLPNAPVHDGRGISVTKDDRRFLDYVGGDSQDLDTTVYVYDRTRGCRWLNTQTGQVGGQWGPTGTYSGDRGWTIHNARMSKNGQWARITSGGGPGGAAGVYLWNIESLRVIACDVKGPLNCGGHLVTGFDRMINQRGVGDGMEFVIRPMSDPDRVTALITPLLSPTQFKDDTHPSWNNVRSDERQPVCMSAYRPDDLVERAWDGEIICIATDATSTVWRFAHHRSRVVSFADQPRANVSQDGRLMLFTSNWEGTVGSGRQDAFIVQLAPPEAAVDR